MDSTSFFCIWGLTLYSFLDKPTALSTLNSIQVSLLVILYVTDSMIQIPLLSGFCLKHSGSAQDEKNYRNFQANHSWMEVLLILCKPCPS